MFKPLWKAIRAFIQGTLHSVLVPVITVLKSLESGIKHLIKELSKV